VFLRAIYPRSDDDDCVTKNIDFIAF